MDATMIFVLVLGFVLLLGSMVALTTFGKKYPAPVLTLMFIAFAVYMSIILVRIEVIDLSWLMPG